MPNAGHPITELIKERELGFSALHPDPNQTESALMLLKAMEYIEHAEQTNSHCVRVRYDVRHITLEIIEAVLLELGFHLESSLLYKLKRSLYYYTEDTLRTNLGITHATTVDTKQVFMNRYQQLAHGCRDVTPAWLRHYR